MNLTKKGLLVVGVPLVFWIVFILFLQALEIHARQVAHEERRSKQSIAELNEFIRDGIAYTTVLGFYVTSHSESFKARVDALDKGMVDHLNRLSATMSPSKAQRANYEALKSTTEDALKFLRGVEDAAANNTMISLPAGLSLTREVELSCNSIIQKASEMVEEEKKLNEQYSKEDEGSRRTIEVFLFAGVISNICMSIAASMYLSKSITQRVKVLVDNTMRFSEQKELNQRLQGRDEISRLDSSFHEMTQQVNELTRRESLLVRFAADPIFSLDRQLRFVRVNPMTTELFKYEEGDLVGAPVDKILQDPGTLKDRLNSNSEQLRLSDLTILTSSGEELHMDWNIVWSMSDELYFCVARDVTERTKIEEMKRDFIHMLSHDLRSPLSSMGTYLEILADGVYGQLNDDGLQLSHSIRRSIDYSSKLVNDFLELERMDHGAVLCEPELVFLPDIIEPAVSVALSLAESRGSTIIAETYSESASVEGDPVRLVEVVQNFLTNAVKYSPGGSMIRICVEEQTDTVTIAVHDQAEPIPVELRTRIFERFWRSPEHKGQTSSMGLGLSICKNIVEAHNGSIGTSDGKLGGNCFFVTLPRSSSRKQSRD